MKYRKTIRVDGYGDRIRHLLTHEPKDKSECFGEDERIAYFAEFPDVKIVVALCGVQYREGESNLPWTQAVMYDRMTGREICFTDPDDDFFGLWTLEHGDDIYEVNVKDVSGADRKENAKYTVKIVYTHTVEVEASSEDEAIEKANELAWQEDADENDSTILSKEPIAHDV